MIKPWQKASLSLVSGLALYGGFLSVFSARTKALNEQAAKARQDVADRGQLLQVLATENKNLALLKASLAKVRSHTDGIDQQIHKVEQQIQELRAGKLVQTVPVSTAPLANLKTQLVSLPPMQAPAVQAVSKASGG